MVPLTVDMQFSLEGGFAFDPAFDPAFGGGSGWVSVGDVRVIEPIAVSYGIRHSSPIDCIADAGVMTFALDNSAANSAGVPYWYSPLHAVARGGFDFNIQVRLVLSYGGAPYYKFYGRLGNISVEPGKHGTRIVRCTVLDLMDDYARTAAPGVPPQLNTQGAFLIDTLIDALPSDLRPPARAMDTSAERFPIALDTLREESMSMREALHLVCLSDLSKLYITGTSLEPGGLLLYQSRHAAALNTYVNYAFNDDMVALDVPGTREELVSIVRVFVHPTRVDPAATTVLFALETTSTLIQPGETNDTLFGGYRDPDNPGTRVGGLDMQPPIATTDYLMNTAQDGTGADVTASFAVVASFTGAGVRFTITNGGGVAGYLTKLQVRGRGIYRTTAMVEKIINADYGQQVEEIEMPFQTDINIATDVVTYRSQQLSRPLARARSVTFCANRTPTLLSLGVICEPGYRISITETVTGLDAEEFLITGVSLQIDALKDGGLMWVTWYLEPASTQRYWIAGIAGASEAGITTVAGF